MTEQDAIDRRNTREIDRIAADWVESVRRAVTENPFGSATLTLKWQHHAILRVVKNQETSEALDVSFQP